MEKISNKIITKSQMTLRGSNDKYQYKIVPICNRMFSMIRYNNADDIRQEIINEAALRVVVDRDFEERLDDETLEKFIYHSTTNYN
jgi:hypothetical protein